MDSCPASNTMYYNAGGVQEEEDGRGKKEGSKTVKGERAELASSQVSSI